jgi:hypothetical protein
MNSLTVKALMLAIVGVAWFMAWATIFWFVGL